MFSRDDVCVARDGDAAATTGAGDDGGARDDAPKRCAERRDGTTDDVGGEGRIWNVEGEAAAAGRRRTTTTTTTTTTMGD